MEKYLMDTCVVSKFLAANLPEEGMNFVGKVFDQSPFISFVTQIEILCIQTDMAMYQILKSFISDCMILSISDDLITKCVEIRRNHKKIKIPDALIASTAIINKMILISTDESDFKAIKDLTVINPNNIRKNSKF